MSKVWVVAVPVLLVALWALTLWAPQREQRAQPPRAAHDSDDASAAPRLPVAQAAKAPALPPENTNAPAASSSSSSAELPRLPAPPLQGPVRALKQRYDGESASGASLAQQQQLTAAVAAADVDLLHNVECRRSVCRLRLSWQPRHGFSGMRLLAELRGKFDRNLAIDEAGPSGASGSQTVDIYIDLNSSELAGH